MLSIPRTTDPNHNAPLEGELLEKIETEIASLTQGLEHFDYAQLRATLVPQAHDEKEEYPFHRASEPCVRHLLQLFASTFLYSKDRAIREFFATLERQPLAYNAHIIALGNTLLAFKKGVQTAELNYFKERDMMLATIRPNATWVMHFHFIMEQYFEWMPNLSLGDYHNMVKNIQVLGEKVYRWCERNAAEHLERYKTLQPLIVGAAAAPPHKRKADFLNFVEAATVAGARTTTAHVNLMTRFAPLGTSAPLEVPTDAHDPPAEEPTPRASPR